MKGRHEFIIFISSIFAVIAIVAIFFGVKKNDQVNVLEKRVAELEIIDQRKAVIIDSAMVVIGKQADSLRIAKNTINVKHEEWVKLNIITALKNRQHENIIFYSFTSDSLRWRELSKLYPTINN